MDLVVDANVLFSVFIKDGVTAELLLDEDLHLFAPEFIIEEFEDHKYDIIRKTTRTEREFNDLYSILKTIITIFPVEEFNQFIQKAEKLSPDPDDVHYFALALKLHCGIWSNDKALKHQNKVLIFNTSDIMARR